MNKIFTKIAIFFSVFISISHFSYTNIQKQSQNDITLKAGIPENFPPHYIISENKSPAGFAIDIMNKIADLTGYRIKYITYKSWEDAHEALIKNEIDIIPNMGFSEERSKIGNFTIPLEVFPISIFVRKSDNDIKNINSLKNRKVAVIKSNLGHQIMQQNKNVKLLVYNTPSEGIFSLLSGNSDALIFPEPIIYKIAHDADIDDRIKVIDVLVEVKRGIVVNKNRIELVDKFNKVIEKFISSPDYKRIYIKWFSTPKPFWTFKKIIFSASMIIVIVITVMIIWRYYSLIKINKKLKLTIIERKNAEEKIKKSLEEKKILIKEIHHRVKNNLSLIYSLLHFQRNNISDAYFDKILEGIQSRIKSISILHQRLYNENQVNFINFLDYCNELIKELKNMQANTNRINTIINIEPIMLDIDIAIPCGLIINELYTNAINHAFPNNIDGLIDISFKYYNNSYILTFSDNGIGMSSNTNSKNSKSIGMYIINLLTKQLNGNLYINTEEGTSITINFKG